ncbi:MAG: hypothetical protein ACLQHM_08215 [Limisphaerales bacterium]
MRCQTLKRVSKARLQNFLRREDEKLEAAQVWRIITVPLSIEASAKLDG